MTKLLFLFAMAACGNDQVHHLADSAVGGGDGGGSAMPEPCNLMVASTEITVSTTTQCGQVLVNNTTVAIDFDLFQGSDEVRSEIACTITPGVVPQTLTNRSGTSGCNVEVDYNAANGGTQEWDNATPQSVTITVTDLDPLGGMIDVMLSNASAGTLTVSGTY